MSKSRVPGLSVSVAALTLAALSAPVAAVAQGATYRFDIPAQDLATALREYGRVSRQQIVFDSAITRGLRSTALSGELGADQALSRLLSGSGLGFRRGGTGVVIITRPEVQEGNDPVTASLDDVVVTGTLIEGVRNQAAPTFAITRDEIVKSGFLSVEALTESLPQNFSEIGSDTYQSEGISTLATNNSVERASGIDLRGLGAQSTLVLLNGSRRAGGVDGRIVDVSMIPLSAVDRVEVVTGGRSAIYGSDAVAGVVNFVTRRDFDGAETQAAASVGEHGGESVQFSQTVGVSGEDRGFLFAYDYRGDNALDLVDTGLVAVPAPNGFSTLRFDIQPRTERHSIFAAGHHELTPGVELTGDVLYSTKRLAAVGESLFPGAANPGHDINNTRIDVFSAGVGLDIGLDDDWKLKLKGVHSTSRAQGLFDTRLDLGFFALDFLTDRDLESQTSSVSAVASGDLPDVFGVTPRSAFGIEARRESFESVADSVSTLGSTVVTLDRSRDIVSAFGEVLLPLMADGAGDRRLDLSLAGRYDDYSDVGDTFNPQVGVVFGATDSLLFRAAYSRAFRASAPGENPASNTLAINDLPDVGNVLVPVLELGGTAEDLEPETADTWTAGFDFAPTDWLRASLDYYNIEYRNRLDVPAIGSDATLILQREDRFPGQVIRNPTQAQVDAFLSANVTSQAGIGNGTGVPFDPATQNLLTVFPNVVLFDNRFTNIAVETVDGLDLMVEADFPTQHGVFGLALNASYTLGHTRSVTGSSPEVDRLNEVGKPADFRARATGSWSTDDVNLSVSANFTDSYDDPFAATPTQIDAWTTWDATLVLTDLWSRAPGLSLAFSVHNLFDEDPPAFENSYAGIRYDPANANAVGRTASVRLIKRW